MNETLVRKKYGYIDKKKPRLSYDLIKKSCCNLKQIHIKQLMVSFLPILSWIPKYKLRHDLFPDFVSGLTQGVMKISQGLAYAQLAGQHPVYGMYSCLFPCIFYTLFASSRHLSFGPTASANIILGVTIETLVASPNITSQNSTALALLWKTVYDERIIYGSLMTLLSGLLLTIVFMFRLTFVMRVLSSPIQSGFMFGAICILYISQLKVLLGIPVPTQGGPFASFQTIYDIGKRMTSLSSNEQIIMIHTCIVSFLSILCLVLFKVVNKKISKISKISLPAEILLIICATLVSQFTGLHEIVSVIGTVPQGFPSLTFPDISKTGEIFMDTVSVTIVGISIVLALGFQFSEKAKYEFDPIQEVRAVAFCNILSSFFQSLPVYASVSRSNVQFDSGSKTQLVGWFSSIVIIIGLYSGPLLEKTPLACLSAIVCVSVFSTLDNYRDAKNLFKSQKLDCLVWLVTCFAIICFQISAGLLIGVVFNLLITVVKISYEKVQVIERIENTNIFRERGRFEHGKLVDDNLLIVSLPAPISYLTSSSYQAQITKLIEKSYKTKEWKKYKEVDESVIKTTDKIQEIAPTSNSTSLCDITTAVNRQFYVIIDFSAVSFIDSVGVTMVMKMVKILKAIDVNILIVNCQDKCLNAFLSEGYYNIGEISFVSTTDAVQFVFDHK